VSRVNSGLLLMTPVIEFDPIRTKQFPWVPKEKKDTLRWISVTGETKRSDVLRVVGTILAYNDVAASGDLDAAMKSIQEGERWIVSGGVRIERGAFVCTPGCCSGLESWTEMRGLRPGSVGPWMGHDPSPSIECGDQVLKVSNGFDAPIQRGVTEIEATYPEFKAAVQGIVESLNAFSGRLAETLSDLTESGESFVSRFRSSFFLSGGAE
jgi:hypothetical protein